MNILVIGNGFDLAHGLPTRYRDFLDFVEVVGKIVERGYEKTQKSKEWKNLNGEVQELIRVKNGYDHIQREFSQQMQKCWELINDNIWIKFFLLRNNMEQKENWIDFESKISSVIKGIGREMKKEKAGENSFVKGISSSALSEKLLEEYDQIGQKRKKQRTEAVEQIEKHKDEQLILKKVSEHNEEFDETHLCENAEKGITYRKLIRRLKDDLGRLICALEIYLAGFVEEIAKKIEASEKIKNIENFSCDCVLSFNYTNTYQSVYGGSPNIDFIHGKANIGNPAELNNMVLGIDEYLKGKRKNQDIKFISFKKYYQRIFKKTGCQYQEWLDDIKPEKPMSGQNDACLDAKNHKECEREKPEPHNLYIFGHSLDVTDKDILSDLILADNVKTTIFYYSKEDLGAKIANLVKVIGKNELIKRTGGRTKTIEFLAAGEENRE